MAEVIELDIRAKSQQLQTELDKAVKRVNDLKQQAAVIPVGADIGAIKLKLQLAKQEVQGLKGELKEVKLAEKAAESVSGLNTQLGRSRALIFDITSGAAKFSQVAKQGFTGLNLQASKTSALLFDIGNGSAKFTQVANRGFVSLREELSKKISPSAITAINSDLGNMSGLLSGIKAGATQALGFGAAALSAAVIAKLVTTFGDAVTNAREFGVEISKINTTLPNGIRLTKQQEQALIDLGDAYGRTGAEEAAAYFEIISNGVEDTAVASDILKASNQAALAGITSLDSAARLITTTFNAYSRQGATATEITDSLVVATQLSGVKFEDLASSLGRVTALAANSNISIGELSGTVAFLNKNSLTTEQAITGVRGILNAIIKPSEEATQIARRLGIEFSSTALESKGLVKFLAEVSKATGNNSTTLSRLFGDINAINAVIAISKGGFDSFKDAVDRSTNSSGAAAKAANELKKSLDFTLDRQEAAYKNLSITLGNFLRPAVTLTAEAITNLTLALGSAFKTKGPDDLNKQIERTDKIITAIQEKDFYRLQNLGIQTTALSTAGLNKLLDEQLAKRAALAATAAKEEKARVDARPKDGKGGKDDPSTEVDNATQQELAARQRFEADITAIKLEGEAARAAIDLDTRNAKARAAGEEFLSQSEVELEQSRLQIEAVYAAELEKNRVIADAKAQRLANDLAFQKREEALLKASATFENKAARESIALAQKETDTRIGLAFAGANLAAAIAKDGSKEQFIIQKAAAIAQSIVAGIQARALALATPPGPPATLPLAATVTGIAAANTAAIAASAIKGFADGGIVGGNLGATAGRDNRLATVRDGEMILNADQQKKLFDMIQGGGMAGSIIIQVDGREIARAVRDQVQQGYKIQ